jgi:hypothetical protein
VTRSTITEDNYLESLLSGIARLATEAEFPCRVLLHEDGLVFEMAKKPFFLRHYLAFWKISEAQNPLSIAETVVENMEREMKQAIQDAAVNR